MTYDPTYTSPPHPADTVAEGPRRPHLWNAAELMATDFPEPRWAVPGVLCEGLNLLAGAPKVGKSWLALSLSIAVASGGAALGKINVPAGDVLYLALEDTARRLKTRLGKLLDGEPVPDRLTITTEWPRLEDGGDGLLTEWVREHPDARLVVVDVFAKVRSAPGSRESVYAGDYAALEPLKKLADDHSLAVLVLHHVRKAGADDWLDTLSGSNGIAGAADGILRLTRGRGRADGQLDITGRDVDEAEHALSFDTRTMAWTLLGAASDWNTTPERQRILEAVREHQALTPKQIAEHAGLSHASVKHLVRRMVEEQTLDTDGQGAYLPVHPVHPLHPDGDGVHRSPTFGEHGERSEWGTGGAA